MNTLKPTNLPDRVSIAYPNMRGHNNSPGKIISEVRDGLKRIGVKHIDDDPSPTSHEDEYRIRVNWGVRGITGSLSNPNADDVLIVERGFLGERLSEWSSLCWNGLNGRGEFGFIPQDNGKRFNEYHSHLLSECNEPSENIILVMGQVPHDMSLKQYGPVDYNAICEDLQQIHGKHNRICFHEHPLAKTRNVIDPKWTQWKFPSLEEALARASFSVSINSNASLLSVLSGTPTHVIDPKGSILDERVISPIDSYHLEENLRREFLSDLAWKQWSREEIRSGSALEHVLLR